MQRLRSSPADRADHALGNTKARQRRVARYGTAAALGGLATGTDHAAEAVTGFSTGFGDGGVDVTPLTG